MFISIVLNVEYMNYASRIKWYLKNLSHCKENNWILITHEYMLSHFKELQESVTDRLFEEFEMHKFSLDELNSIEQYFISDDIFDEREQQCGSRTEFLFDVFHNRYHRLEHRLNKIIDEIRSKHEGEKIDGVFNCLEAFESVRCVFDNLNIPLVSYVFSAFRKPHGYRQTLYSANIEDKLYCSHECEKRYATFLKECPNVPILENREIIALLGKERTLPLIKLLDYPPEFEVGVCCELFAVLPHIFFYDKYTDDDVFYECDELYDKNKVIVRSHAAQLDLIQISRENVRNDPASFLLSCKRVAAVRSQIILKAMLWNRTVIMKKNTLPFSFMCQKNYDSENLVDIAFLNYYIFCYLIPNELMFSDDYWRWRLANPKETEIYHRHLAFYIAEFGLKDDVFKETDTANRFRYILESRKCSKDLVDNLLSEKEVLQIDFNATTSKIMIDYIDGGKSKAMWCLNSKQGEELISSFVIEAKNVDSIKFFPLDDVAGYTSLRKVVFMLNDQVFDEVKYPEYFCFMNKNFGCYEIPFSKKIAHLFSFRVVCFWKYKK